MCFLQPLKVKKIGTKHVTLENDMKALCDENVKGLKVGDSVLVYGNLIISKVNANHEKKSAD